MASGSLRYPHRIGHGADGFLYPVFHSFVRTRCAQPFPVFRPCSCRRHLVMRRRDRSHQSRLARSPVSVPRRLPESPHTLVNEPALDGRNAGLHHCDRHDVIGLGSRAILPPVEIIVHKCRIRITAGSHRATPKYLKRLWDGSQVRHESPRNDNDVRAVLSDLVNYRTQYHPVGAIDKPAQQGCRRRVDWKTRAARNDIRRRGIDGPQELGKACSIG